MTELFLGFLNRGIAAGWLVLAVVLVRTLLRRAPKWADVLLWGMVALRLVLPFSIESTLSLLPSTETIRPEVVQYDPAPTITSGVSVIDNAVNPVLRESFAADPAASVNPLFVWTEIAGVVWLLGVAALLGYTLVSYLRLRRRLQTAVRLEGNIYQSEYIASPFVLGVFRPTIYLPCTLSDADHASVLAHERAHLARRDHWWKPLGFLLLTLYWFHPMLWLAYVLFCRDVELACDERVVRTLDPAHRADYSQALLACSVPRRMVAACPLAFGEVGVKERVKSVLHYKRPAFWVVVLSVLICTAVAVCFLTNPQRETMKWAKNLRVEDVARIELTTMPQMPDKQYKDFDADEIAEAVALINKSSGRYVRSMEPLAGSSTELYVTTTDGVRHTVVNSGNVYLCIDGDAYRNFYIAWPYTEGDSPLPESFGSGMDGAVSAPSLTGYAAYDTLLTEIGEQRRFGAGDADVGFSSELLSENDYYQTAGWLLRDLDGDGTSELLLGADWGGGHTVIFNIYRLDGAEAIRTVDGWSRSRWYLCADGSLANEGSSGASESSFSYYRYENGALQHLETLLLLDDGSGGSPWLYSDTVDHASPDGSGFRAVSEDEADAVMSRYVYEALAFAPFP